MLEAVEAAGKVIKVAKNHLFAIGDFVTAGGKFDGASDKITAIDKSNAAYDSITLAAAIGAMAKEISEVVITMAKVDLTVANQSCGLMVRGTIEERNMPFPLDADLKKLMPLIRFV